jgi:hypothetical protein
MALLDAAGPFAGLRAAPLYPSGQASFISGKKSGKTPKVAIRFTGRKLDEKQGEHVFPYEALTLLAHVSLF